MSLDRSLLHVLPARRMQYNYSSATKPTSKTWMTCTRTGRCFDISCILLFGDFLTKTLSNANGNGKFRIIEVGAGSGGTTKYIVNHLRRHGISFEYIFTDLSAFLVAAAKRRFKGIEGMEVSVLDVEKPSPDEYLGEFHVVISTNCVHATSNLKHSLLNLRKMLREDGVLALVEVTQNMFLMDIAVGLFEGWWLFNDGRSHVVAGEAFWERNMKESDVV